MWQQLEPYIFRCVASAAHLLYTEESTMKKALTELWYIQTALADHDSDDAAGEKRLSEYLDKHFSDLSKKLDDHDKEILQKYYETMKH